MQAVLPVAAAVGCLHACSLGAMNTSAWCYNCSLILVSGLSHHPETRESKSSYSTFIKTTEVQGCSQSLLLTSTTGYQSPKLRLSRVTQLSILIRRRMQASTKDKIQLYSHMKDIPKESLRSHKAEIGGELGFILFQTLRLSDSQTPLQSVHGFLA